MMKEYSNPITKELVVDIPIKTLRAMYVTMVKIREVEERIAELLLQKEIKCPTHLYIGQEAVAVGVCINLRREDYVFGTHRSHGHYIAKGGDLRQMMAELYGKRTGCSKGRGGSMHLTAPEVGILGTSAMVASSIPLAVGAALASARQRNNRVAVVFFGDGATDEGAFHESLNFAALKKLPIVFLCENNFYSTHLHLLARQPVDNIYQRAEAHGLPGIRIDGNNVIEVFHVSHEAIESARNGRGPTLIECRTYRWRGHVGPHWDLDKGVRTKEEVDEWVAKCPIKRYEEFLLNQGILTELERAEIFKQVGDEIEEAIIFAKESPFPDERELTEHVFKE